MNNLHDKIKLRAYMQWVREGKPEGRAKIHWLAAERQLLIEAAGDDRHRLPPRK